MLKKVYSIILQLLYPLRCPVCDHIVTPFGRKICYNCSQELKYIKEPFCMKCGKQLEDETQEYCRDCDAATHLFVRGRALYEYDGAASSIYRFKYGGRREYADFYGEEIARHLGGFIERVQPQALIPIPLHPARRAKRGYNQAYLLACALSRYTGVPVCDKMLVRIKNTVPLKQLNPGERQNNLKKAFHIKGNDVKLKTILLVDDIYTTGATMDEATAVLRKAGVKNVYFITLACGRGV